MKNENNYNLLEEKETNISSVNKNSTLENNSESNNNFDVKNRNSGQKMKNSNSIMIIDQDDEESYDGNIQENFSRKFVSKSKEEDLRYYRSIYYLPIFAHFVLISLLILIPLFPIYFIQIKHITQDSGLNIKLSYIYVRYNHALYNYDCFNECYDLPTTKCEKLDIADILNNYVADCKDYNNAKNIFLSVSKYHFSFI